MSYSAPFDAQVPPLQWIGGHDVHHLISLTGYESLPLRDRWSLIDRIEQQQDKYQGWLTKMPATGAKTEQVRSILQSLKAKRVAIYLTIRPEHKGKIQRANQTSLA